MATTISDQQVQQTNLEDLCSCLICTDIIKRATITRCGHRFCRQCIERWFLKQPDCPACRRPLRATDFIKDYTFDDIIDVLPRKSKELAELQKCRKRLEEQCQGMKKELRYLEDKLIPNIDAFSKDPLSNRDAAKWKIKRLDQEIDRLRSFEQLCKDKDDELKKASPIKQAQLDTLGEKILKLKAEDAAQRDQIETLRNKIKSLELELAKTAKEQKQTLADLQRKSRDLAEVQTSTEKLNNQCSTLTSELRHMKDELIPNKDTIIKKIERQNSDLLNDVQSKREKLTELEMCKQNLELQCNGMRTELQRLKQEVIPNKDADIKKINQENTDLQSTNATQKGQIETMRCKEVSLELKIASRTEENKQILDYNRRILDELQNKREELEKLQTCKENLGIQAKTLRNELQHLKEELLPKKDIKIAELQAAYAVQQCQKESIELKHISLTEEHQQTLNENRQFSDGLHRHRKEITELETYRENLKQRCHELWTELQQKEEAMSDKNSKLQSDLQSKYGELDNMEQHCQKLKAELQVLKEEVIPNKDRLIEKIRRNNSCIDFTKLFLMVVCLGVCFGFLRVWFSVPSASLYVL